MDENADAGRAVTTPHKKHLLVIAVVTAVVAAGAFAAWMLLLPKKAVAPSGTGAPVSKANLTPAQAAYARSDYQAAARALEAEGRTDLDGRLELAVAYENAKEYDKALTVYDQLEQAGKLSANYTFRAGEVAYAKKDTAAAIRYYELAKERYKKEGSRRLESKLRRCDDRLAELRKAGA